MFRQDSTTEAAFRQQVRGWLETNLPMPLRGRTARPAPAELMPWYRKVSERGWIAPHWPKAYGGMGASLGEQIILAEELARLAAPNLPVQGINHLGPILMKFGSPRAEGAAPAGDLRGDVIWAQGYSEPGAGSDLASLTTRAVLDGDKFHRERPEDLADLGVIIPIGCSRWCAPIRTRSKQAGISFLLIKLDSPGIRRRPIVNIADDDELSEMFFDNVVVPARKSGRTAERRLGDRQRLCSRTNVSTTPIRSTRSRRSRGSRRSAAPTARSTTRCSRTASPACGSRLSRRRRCSATRSASPERPRARRRGVDPQDRRLGKPAGDHRSAGRDRRQPRRRQGSSADRGRRRRRHPDFPAVAPRDHLQRIERNPAQHPRQACPESSDLTAALSLRTWN